MASLQRGNRTKSVRKLFILHASGQYRWKQTNIFTLHFPTMLHQGHFSDNLIRQFLKSLGKRYIPSGNKTKILCDFCRTLLCLGFCFHPPKVYKTLFELESGKLRVWKTRVSESVVLFFKVEFSFFFLFSL